MEELGTEELQLLQEIRDTLAAMVRKLDAQACEKPELDEPPRKRTDSERKAMLIERLFARYNPYDAEFFDHIPYLEKRLLRIRRAGKQKRPRSKQSRSKPRAASRSSAHHSRQA